MIMYILGLILTGLIVGALARLALPGRDPMGIGTTILIGIAGSLIAGLVVYALTDGQRGAGILLSVVVSTGLVYLVRRSRGGTLTKPAPGHDRLGGPVGRHH
jgi:uncharacterized membrane protein YeaQ/YmgE (transglycosylase-associated protein family)